MTTPEYSHDFYINFDRILLAEDSLWFGDKKRKDLYLRAMENAFKEPPRKWGDSRKLVMRISFLMANFPGFSDLTVDRLPLSGALQASSGSDI